MDNHEIDYLIHGEGSGAGGLFNILGGDENCCDKNGRDAHTTFNKLIKEAYHG